VLRSQKKKTVETTHETGAFIWHVRRMSLRHSLTSSTCCCRCPVATCSYWERQSRSRGTGRPLDLSQQAEPPRSPRPPPRRVSSCLLKCTGGLDLAVRSGKCGTQRREKAIAAAGAVWLHAITWSRFPIGQSKSLDHSVETFKTFFKFNVIANSRTVQKIYFTNDGKCAWEHRRRG